MAIPTSTTNVESIIASAPISKVWSLIKSIDQYPKWWKLLQSAEKVRVEGGEGPVDGEVTKWKFGDGTVVDVKLEEFSALKHSITWSTISSTAALAYTSSNSTITLYEVTTGKHEGSTLVVWTGEYSGDAGADTIQDGKYKRKEGLEDLVKAVA